MTTTNQENNKKSREIPYHLGPLRIPRDHNLGGGRPEMINAFSTHWEEIIQRAGSVSVSAPKVLQIMHELGLLQHVAKSNGIGDVLGARHFKLPHAVHKAKRLYLIAAIPWDADEREAFFALSPAEQVDEVRALETKLLGIEDDSVALPDSKIDGAEAEDDDATTANVPEFVE